MFWRALGHNLSKFCQIKPGRKYSLNLIAQFEGLTAYIHLVCCLSMHAILKKNTILLFFVSEITLHSADVTKAMWAENNNVNQQNHSPLFTI